MVAALFNGKILLRKFYRGLSLHYDFNQLFGSLLCEGKMNTITTKMAACDWKLDILQQIRKRNERQSQPYSSLIQTNNRLQEIAANLHTKTVHLQVEVERLKEENLTIKIRGDGGGGSGAAGASLHALEQKLYKLQEELTEMHKKKGENSQQIIDLNAALQEKEKEILKKDALIAEMESTNIALVTAQGDLQQINKELEATNQMLKDEHQALQMAFSALEEKYRKCQDDNSDLINRWMAQKSRDADRMNAENATFIQQRQSKLKKELEEAANEQVSIDLSKDPLGGVIEPVCIMASVPTQARCKFDAHESEVYSIQWSTSEHFFATGGADRKIKLWEYSNGVCDNRGMLVGSNAGITSLDYSSDDRLIVGASNDFASRVWSLTDLRLRHTLTGHSGKVLSSKFISDNKVVSGSHDRTLKIWDLHSRACIRTIFAGSSCNDLVTLQGTNIISGHFDKRVRFWDIRGNSSTNEILLQGRLTSLSLASDKTQLLCCTRDDCLKVIDLRMNQVSTTLAGDGFKVGCDWCRAVFSPDAEYVAAGSGDGHLYVWNISKSKVERILSKEHNHSVVACSWNPNGNSIISCEKGRRVVLWSDY